VKGRVGGLRAWAELLRVSALFTVPGDALAGAAAAGRAPNRGTAYAVGASLCLYEAGMALNDWADRAEDAVDRPHRPIPSGRITPTAALLAAGALTAAGLALAARAGRPSLAVAAALSATVWSYDLHFKHTAAGPTAMATARGLDLLLGAVATGASGASAARGETEPSGEPSWGGIVAAADPAGAASAGMPKAREAGARPARASAASGPSGLPAAGAGALRWTASGGAPEARGAGALLARLSGSSAGNGAVPGPAAGPTGRLAAGAGAPHGVRPSVVAGARVDGLGGAPAALSRGTVSGGVPKARGAGERPARASAASAASVARGAVFPRAVRTSGLPAAGGVRPAGPARLGAGGALLAAVPAAVVLGAHTYAVTAVSRHEAQGGSTAVPLVALAATLGLGALVAGEVRGTGGSPTGDSFRRSTTARILAAAYVRTVAKPLLHAALNPSPPLTQRAVGGGIRAMIPLQAALAARAGSGVTALAVMGLVPLARKLARKVSPT
jgi:4-hydroxybenzoate polyprenyltransferase